SSTATTTQAGVAPASDLSITKTDAPDPVTAGQTLTYTIAVTNNGPSDATGVTVTDTLPPNVTFRSASPGRGHSSRTVTCAVGALSNGAMATITITVTVTPTTTGSITNSATVTGSPTDPVSDNNTATASTMVTAAGTTTDLSVTKDDDPHTVLVNGTLT